MTDIAKSTQLTQSGRRTSGEVVSTESMPLNGGIALRPFPRPLPARLADCFSARLAFELPSQINELANVYSILKRIAFWPKVAPLLPLLP
jgi:hypothetical protein